MRTEAQEGRAEGWDKRANNAKGDRMETTREVVIGPDLHIGGGAPLALIAGPCAIESQQHAPGDGRSIKGDHGGS